MVIIVIVVVIFVEFVLWEVPIAVGRQELVQLHPLRSCAVKHNHNRQMDKMRCTANSAFVRIEAILGCKSMNGSVIIGGVIQGKEPDPGIWPLATVAKG
jgi:hypothetical protein